MNKVRPDFWRGRRVFVTGHTGFKGSWLCLWLKSLGAEVTGYALPPPTTPSLFNSAKVADGIAHQIADIRDLDTLVAAMKTARPEIALHLAAQPLVRRSYEDPVETFSTNVLGTVHFFEAVRQIANIRVAVGITSDKCYENREIDYGYRENDPMGGHDPYSSSKGCAELVSSAYRRSFFHSKAASTVVATVRAGNVIGGGDWSVDRLLPDLVRAAEGHHPITIRSPHAIRPWQHVLDPLSGYLHLAETLWEKGHAFAEGWNFGPDDVDCRSVREVAEKFVDLWGEPVPITIEKSPQPHEAVFLKLDCSLAGERLNWRPRWRLDRSLKAIVDWHRAYRNGADARTLCVNQIKEFSATPELS